MKKFLKFYSNNFYFKKSKVNNFDKKKKFQEERKKIFELSDTIFENLIKILEAKFHTGYTKNFWKIYLYPWIFFFVCNLVDRIKHVKINKYRKVEFKKKINLSNILFLDSKSYINCFLNDIKTNFVFCNILYNILNKKKTNFILKNKLKQKNISFISKYILLIYKYILPTNELVVRSFGIKSFILNYFLYKKFIIPKVDLVEDTNIDLSFRKEIKINFKNRSQLNNIINFLIPYSIPKSFIENFTNLKNNIEKDFPFNVSKIYTESSIWQEDTLRFWSAINKFKGSKINFFQHGGAYTEKINGQVDLEYFLSDNHIIFAKKNKKKEIQYTDKVFLRNKNINKPKNNRILFPISFVSNFNTDYQHPANTEFNFYYKDVFDFLDNINKEVQKKITLRLVPNIDKKNIYLKILKNKYSHLKIEIPKKSIKESLKDYNLFIGSINSTTFIESFLSGISSIHILSKNTFLPKKCYKNFYDKLKRENIIFENGKSAAIFLNRKINDDKYWSSNKRKKSNREFIKNIIFKKI